MNDIVLIEGRHEIVMNGDRPMFNSDGNLLVQDIQDNNIFAIPMCEETMKFFNLQCAEEFAEEIPLQENSSNEVGIAELSESTASTVACWKDDNEVRCLIYLWQDYQNHFQKMKSRDVWPLISEALKKSNSKWHKKTPIQCENKWKDIKRKYMETKDYNNKSGNDPKTCKFYDELEEILGEKPCVQPVAIASNLNKKRTSISSTDQNDSEDMSEECRSIQNEEASLQRKKKRKISRVQRELLDWLATLLADAKTREEARERRHKENISESKAAVDAFKEMIAKLIDKL